MEMEKELDVSKTKERFGWIIRKLKRRKKANGKGGDNI
jgi:hypothetical protein